MRKDRVFQIRLTEQELTDLRRIAARQGKTCTQVLRDYIARAVKRIGP